MEGRKMHQTTVRFGPDLWDEIEVEARRAGVSVAQYVRDSALMRVSYTRGRDGDVHYDAALAGVEASHAGQPSSGSTPAEDAQERAGRNIEDSRALVSETAQARRKARQLRDDAARRRGSEPARASRRD
jgi:hypothetical protein